MCWHQIDESTCNCGWYIVENNVTVLSVSKLVFAMSLKLYERMFVKLGKLGKHSSKISH